MADDRRIIALLVILGVVAVVSGGAFAVDEAASGDTGGDVNSGDADANLAAFLALIRQAESSNDYQALVGGGQFSDMSDHPANKGWAGVHINGGPLTTAAGAYQITRTTWNSLRAQNGELSLPDFLPQSQDAAAVLLIKGRGAYNLVLQGQFTPALQKLRGEWESFDRMFNGTYPMTLDDATAYYENQGGTVVT